MPHPAGMPPTPSPTTAVVGATSWLAPNVVVAICAAALSIFALLFTIGSFWWMNMRRGKLTTVRPHSFAACLSQQDILINLPLVLHNDAAQPIFVQDFRLRLEKDSPQLEKGKEHDPEEHRALAEEREALPLLLWWRATRPGIQPEPGSRPLPAVLPVGGRKTEVMFIEFGLRKPAFVPRRGPYRAVVEVKMGHRKDWEELLTFDLHTEVVTEPSHYIAYSNDPAWRA